MNTTTPPPHDLNAEMCVVGGLILDSTEQGMAEAMTILSGPEVFWDEANAAIYRALLDLSRENNPTGAAAVISKLGKYHPFEAEGSAYKAVVARLECPGPSVVAHFARIVAEKHRLRLLDLAAQNMSASILMGLGDSGDIAGKASDAMSRAMDGGDAGLISMTEAFELVIARLRAKKPLFMPTPFRGFDTTFGGIPEGTCNTLIGTPNSGKTTLCIQLLARIADHGIPILLYSNEQTAERIGATLLAQRSGLPIHDWLGRGNSTLAQDEQVVQAAANIGPIPIYQCPKSLNAREIYALAKLNRQRGVKFVYVDYLQQLAPLPGMSNEAERIGESMRLLQAITRDMGMTTLIVSQIDLATSKATTYSGDSKRKPTMFDAVGSGKIGQFSDYMYSVFRPHMHEAFDESDPDGWRYRQTVTEFAVLKAKFGPRGSVNLRFNPQAMEFVE